MGKEKKEKLPKRLRGFGRAVRIGSGLREQLKPGAPEFYWWRSKAIESLWAFFLVALNFRLALPFFDSQFKYAFSAPMIPFLGKMVSVVPSLPLEAAISTVILIFYIFGPLTLYFLVKEVTARLLPAVSVALIFSSPIFKSRLLSILLYDDGAHIVALTLIPLVSSLALKFLRRGFFSLCIFTSLGMTLVALTSPFGLFVCSIFLVIITFSEMLLAHGRLKLLRLVTVFVLTAGFSAFWYNPDFVRLILLSRQGKEVVTTLFNLFPISFFAVPILGTFGFLLFIKRPFLQPLFIALGLTIVFSLFSFAGRLGSSFFVSYPDRYLPELSLSFCFLLGIIITAVFDFLRTTPKVGRFELKPLMGGRVAILFFGFLLLFILFFWGRTSLEPPAIFEEKKVLGVFANHEMVGVGEIRRQTGQLARWFGYLITALTAGMVGYLGIKNKGLGPGRA